MADREVTTLVRTVLHRIADALGAVLASVCRDVGGLNEASPSHGRTLSLGGTAPRLSRRATRGIAWATRGQGGEADSRGATSIVFDKGGPFGATFFYVRISTGSWRAMGAFSRARLDNTAFDERMCQPFTPMAWANINSEERIPK